MIDTSFSSYNIANVRFDVKISKKYFNRISEYMLKNNVTNLSTVKQRFDKKIYYIIDYNIFLEKIDLLLNNNLYEIKEYFKNSFCYRYCINNSIYMLEINKNWVLEITSSNYRIYIKPNDPLLEVYLLRFLRSIAYGINEDNNMILMHGAALSSLDKGIIILGKKGSGKTTLLLNFLKMGADIISNDRLFITEDLNIISFPQALRVGVDTFNNEEKITQYFNEKPFFRTQDKKNNNFKYLIVFHEIQNVFGAKYKNSQYLNYVIVPEIQIGKEGVEIIYLSKCEKKDILESVCFTPIDESFRFDWIYFSKLNIFDKMVNRNKILYKLMDIPFIKVKYGTCTETKKIIAKINNINL